MSSSSSGCITDVPGLSVGHYTDREAATGCTVVIPDSPATAGVDVRGGYPGTRDCDMLDPSNVAVPVDAVLLSGGSNLGLDAASGVAGWMAENDRGSRLGATRVPRVPAAVIFDFGLGDPDVWPGPSAGLEACETAAPEPTPEGTVGAGTGAVVGRLLGRRRAMKGGVGSASVDLGAAAVGALMVVNPIGSVHGPDGVPVAGPRDAESGRPLDSTEILLDPGFETPAWLAGQSTVIGVVATDAALSGPEATRVARMASAGMAATVRPAHTDLDGDAIFCLSLGGRGWVDASRLGAAAAVATARAIVRAVTEATSLHDTPAAGMPA